MIYRLASAVLWLVCIAGLVGWVACMGGGWGVAAGHINHSTETVMATGYACNVGKGIKLDLSCLTEKQKKQLIKFIARVSEVSYRRGFQQGYVSHEYGSVVLDPAKFRYERNIDQAPWAENGKNSGRTAIDILAIEYAASFDSIGIPLPFNF